MQLCLKRCLGFFRVVSHYPYPVHTIINPAVSGLPADPLFVILLWTLLDLTQNWQLTHWHLPEFSENMWQLLQSGLAKRSMTMYLSRSHIHTHTHTYYSVLKNQKWTIKTARWREVIPALKCNTKRCWPVFSHVFCYQHFTPE